MLSNLTRRIAMPFAFLLLMAFGMKANAFFLKDCDWQMTPYIGVDAQIRTIRWNQGLGENLFKRVYPQGNVFAGFRLHDYLGVEGGYEGSITRLAENNIAPEEIVANRSIDEVLVGLVPFVPPVLIASNFQIKGWHLNLVVYIPICENSLDLIGSVGFARLNVFHRFRILADSLVTVNSLVTTRTFESEKNVARLGAGVQYMLNDCSGVRFLLNWENTARFKRIVSLETPTSAYRVSLKNSWIYGLGLFLRF